MKIQAIGSMFFLTVYVVSAAEGYRADTMADLYTTKVPGERSYRPERRDERFTQPRKAPREFDARRDQKDQFGRVHESVRSESARFDASRMRDEKDGVQKLSDEKVAHFIKLKETMTSVSFRQNVRPVFAKICDIDALTKLISDIADNKAFPRDIDQRLRSIQKMQASTFAEAQQRLAGVRVTDQMVRDVNNFVGALKPLFEKSLSQASAMKSEFENLAQDVSYKKAEDVYNYSTRNMREASWDDQTAIFGAKFDTDTMIKMAIVGGLIAVNLLAVLAFMSHNKTLQDVAIALVVIEVISIIAVGCYNAPEICMIMSFLAA